MTETNEKQNLNNRMRILWHSNAPWAPTGYGNQTALIVPRLQKRYDMAISAFYGLEGGMQMLNGVPVYPKGETSYGSDVIGLYASAFQADIAITLIDAWVMNPQMMGNAKAKWIPYYPIDASPVPIKVFQSINKAFDRIVMSKFGERETNNAGLSCHYCPHGIDTAAFYPEDQMEMRKRLAKVIGWNPDAFIVGMVAANNGLPSRKAFEPALRAFADFKAKHSDAQFYIHTYANADNRRMAANIPELIQHFGLTLGRDVFLPDPGALWLGFGNDFMRMIYSSFDVHLLPSMGEGFGIPIVEAQACGCPVIVGDWTAMSELCFSGWKIPQSEAEPFWIPQGAYQYLVKAGAIVNALESAYEVRGNQEYRKRAADGARMYDIERVMEKHWLPTLQKIMERVEASK